MTIIARMDITNISKSFAEPSLASMPFLLSFAWIDYNILPIEFYRFGNPGLDLLYNYYMLVISIHSEIFDFYTNFSNGKYIFFYFPFRYNINFYIELFFDRILNINLNRFRLFIIKIMQIIFVQTDARICRIFRRIEFQIRNPIH